MCKVGFCLFRSATMAGESRRRGKRPIDSMQGFSGRSTASSKIEGPFIRPTNKDRHPYPLCVAISTGRNPNVNQSLEVLHGSIDTSNIEYLNDHTWYVHVYRLKMTTFTVLVIVAIIGQATLMLCQSTNI